MCRCFTVINIWSPYNCEQCLGQLSNYQCLEKYPAPLVVKDIFGVWVCVVVYELWQSTCTRRMPADPHFFPSPLEDNWVTWTEWSAIPDKQRAVSRGRHIKGSGFVIVAVRFSVGRVGHKGGSAHCWTPTARDTFSNVLKPSTSRLMEPG